MKRKIAIAAGILVTAVSTISGSYAYYQDSVTVTNHISTGDVNIGIQEYEKDGDTEKVYAGPKEGIVLPSQTISKIPRITNYAETCYIRVKTTYSGEASDSVSNIDTDTENPKAVSNVDTSTEKPQAVSNVDTDMETTKQVSNIDTDTEGMILKADPVDTADRNHICFFAVFFIGSWSVLMFLTAIRKKSKKDIGLSARRKDTSWMKIH